MSTTIPAVTTIRQALGSLDLRQKQVRKTKQTPELTVYRVQFKWQPYFSGELLIEHIEKALAQRFTGQIFVEWLENSPAWLDGNAEFTVGICPYRTLEFADFPDLSDAATITSDK